MVNTNQKECGDPAFQRAIWQDMFELRFVSELAKPIVRLIKEIELSFATSTGNEPFSAIRLFRKCQCYFEGFSYCEES